MHKHFPGFWSFPLSISLLPPPGCSYRLHSQTSQYRPYVKSIHKRIFYFIGLVFRSLFSCLPIQMCFMAAQYYSTTNINIEIPQRQHEYNSHFLHIYLEIFFSVLSSGNHTHRISLSLFLFHRRVKRDYSALSLYSNTATYYRFNGGGRAFNRVCKAKVDSIEVKSSIKKQQQK